MNLATAGVLGVYLVMSAVALGMYGVDKRRSGRGEWRITEGTLHGIELCGGWPGALLAQRVFRHKWRKGSYMTVFWAIVVAHAAGWAWWLGMFG